MTTEITEPSLGSFQENPEAPLTAHEAADWFLNARKEQMKQHGGDKPLEPLTKQDLNFLLWTAQGQYLMKQGTPLFADEITVTRNTVNIPGLNDAAADTDTLILESTYRPEDYRDVQNHLLETWKTYTTLYAGYVHHIITESDGWRHAVSLANKETHVISKEAMGEFFSYRSELVRQGKH